MQFNSLQYILFLFPVVLLFWSLPQRFHKALLLIASYIFYMSWLPAWGGVLFAITTVNYGLGIWLAFVLRGRRLVFLVFVIFNLALLIFYKYTGFILQNLQGLLGMPSGSFIAAPGAQVIAPLGISFLIFCFIHYGTEVYQGRAPA